MLRRHREIARLVLGFLVRNILKRKDYIIKDYRIFMKNSQRLIASGFLLNGNGVVTLRRSMRSKFFPGYYELPGGKVEFDELPEGALEREFKEETNLKVITRNLYRCFNYTLEDKKEKIYTVELVYFVELNDDFNRLKLSREHDDWKLANFGNLSELNMTGEIRTSILRGFELIGEINDTFFLA